MYRKSYGKKIRFVNKVVTFFNITHIILIKLCES